MGIRHRIVLMLALAGVLDIIHEILDGLLVGLRISILGEGQYEAANG